MSSEEHRPTSRVLDILETLAANRDGLTLSQLSRTLNIPVGSLHTFVRTLYARGYVACSSRGGVYTIGHKTLQLAAAFADDDIYSLTLQEMRHIVDECSEICQLGILDGGNVFYIAKVESEEPLRLVSKVGVSVPACCTALGKCLLSERSREEIMALYPDGMPTLTAHSIRDIDVFCAQLAGVRAGDFARDVSEGHEHLNCFALPIRLNGRIDAAVSVTLPDFRLNGEKEALVRDALSRGRAAIEEHLRSAGRGFSSS